MILTTVALLTAWLALNAGFLALRLYVTSGGAQPSATKSPAVGLAPSARLVNWPGGPALP